MYSVLEIHRRLLEGIPFIRHPDYLDICMTNVRGDGQKGEEREKAEV